MLDYDATLAAFKTNRTEVTPCSGEPKTLPGILENEKTGGGIISERNAREARPLLNLRSAARNSWPETGAEVRLKQPKKVPDILDLACESSSHGPAASEVTP